jgi:hypothetical protein
MIFRRAGHSITIKLYGQIAGNSCEPVPGLDREFTRVYMPPRTAPGGGAS